MHHIQMARILTIALLVAIVTGCATTEKVSQFGLFAEAGKEYAAAMDSLLVYSGEIMVNTDSAKLIQSQADFQGSVTRAKLEESDSAMKENLEMNRLLRRQVAVLSDYFSVLAALANTQAAGNFGQQLDDAVTSLNGLSAALRKTKDIDSLDETRAVAGGVGEMVVRGIQLRSLEKELGKTGAGIAEILRLHGALLEILKNQIHSDLQWAQLQEYEKKVAKPLLEGTISNSDKWKQSRLDLLRPPPADEMIGRAIGAVAKLRASWAKLLVSELTMADIQSVVDDLEPIIAAF